MKKIAIYAFVAAMAAMTVSCGKQADSNAAASEDPEAVETVKSDVAEPEASDADGAAVIKLADDNLFRPDTKVDAVTVLDFNATWCVPCKKLTPAFDKAAEALGEKVKFYSVDIDKNPETAQAFGITSIPTVTILSPNAAYKSYVGLDPFTVGGDVENLSADQLTELIYGNMVKLIDNASK